MKPPRMSAALAALAVTILAWTSVPLLLRHFAQRDLLDAWTVNGIRYIFTALFWLPYVIGSCSRNPPGRRIWRDSAVPAACHCLGQIAWGLSPYYSGAGVMNFVSRIGFLFTILAGFWLLREERDAARRPLFWLAVAGTITGLFELFAGGLDGGNTTPFGMFLLVGAALCWSLYAVNVQRAMRSYGARLGFGVVSLLVAPPLIGLMFAFGDWRAALHLRLSDWLLLALSGWVGIALGHVMYYRAVRSLGPVAAEGSLALMPFLTAVLAGLVLGEHMRASQWVGGSLLVISSMILVFTRVHPSPERAESEAPPGG